MTWTDAEQRERIMDDMERGVMPDAAEIEALVHDADMVEQMQEALVSVQATVERHGYGLIDVTTDDDPAPRFELVVLGGE